MPIAGNLHHWMMFAGVFSWCLFQGLVNYQEIKLLLSRLNSFSCQSNQRPSCQYYKGAEPSLDCWFSIALAGGRIEPVVALFFLSGHIQWRRQHIYQFIRGQVQCSLRGMSYWLHYQIWSRNRGTRVIFHICLEASLWSGEGRVFSPHIQGMSFHPFQKL